MNVQTNQIVLLCIVTSIFLPHAQAFSKRLCYMQKDHTSLLPLTPKRMTSMIWSNVSSVNDCARSSHSKFPVSEGFLFSPTSGQCSPLLWLEGPSSPGAQQVQPDEGILYLSCDVCRDDFQVFELENTAGELVCLRYFDTNVVTQEEAVSQCAALGAFLPSVKTNSKLNVIRSLAASDVWVGFEFVQSQGVHIWSTGQEVITSQQIKDVFYPGEPNNAGGSENCGHFRLDYQALNDILCDLQYHYICEKDLPVSQM